MMYCCITDDVRVSESELCGCVVALHTEKEPFVCTLVWHCVHCQRAVNVSSDQLNWMSLTTV